MNSHFLNSEGEEMPPPPPDAQPNPDWVNAHESVLNNFTTDSLLAAHRASGGRTIRYIAVEVRLGLFESLVLLFRFGKWVRTRRDFVPLLPGQPGYNEAPYEATILDDRRVRRET